MKHFRRLLVALMAFSTGVALTPIRFHVEGWACGRMIDGGGGYSATSYSSSYAVRLTFGHFNYPSTEKADEAFDRHLREAVRVIETTPKLNANGAVIGRRAVAISFNPEVNQSYVSVAWTDGRSIYSIDSPSLLHVLEFEKQNLGAWTTGVSRIRYRLAPDTK